MNSPHSPLVSIITPVMNGERFLDEAIRSARAQAYDNWEYVIVDNCSDDRTGEIAAAHAQEDRRIRVVRNSDRLPMLSNWNHAMRQVSSESVYCKVLHADDMLLQGCLEQMVAIAEANPNISLVSAYRIDGGSLNLFGAVPYPIQSISGREVCRRRLLGGRDAFGSPTSVLYRSSEVRSRDPFYNEDNPHADTEACFELLREGEFGFVHQVLTFTRRHGGAETAKARPLNTHAAGRLQILEDLGREFLDAREYQWALQRYLRNYYRFLGRNPGTLRDPKIRRHHQAALDRVGKQLSLARVGFAAVLESGRRLFVRPFS
jgi:glycosyltransferase involved in cell wall biosynthesis